MSDRPGRNLNRKRMVEVTGLMLYLSATSSREGSRQLSGQEVEFQLLLVISDLVGQG